MFLKGVATAFPFLDTQTSCDYIAKHGSQHESMMMQGIFLYLDPVPEVQNRLVLSASIHSNPSGGSCSRRQL